MAILLRQNVSLDHCCPAIKEAVRLLEKKEVEYGGKNFIILSANDSKHSVSTKHNPTGEAIDFECILVKAIIFNTVKHLGFHAKDIIRYPWGWHMEWDNPLITNLMIWKKLNQIIDRLDNIDEALPLIEV